MGIRLSPLGVAVFCLLGLAVLYHLYSGFLAGRFASFVLGGPPGPGGGLVDLRELLAASVAAAVRGGAEVRRVREGNVLHARAKGKTREGAEEKMTSGDILSNRKMYFLLKAAFPEVQVRGGLQSPSSASPSVCGVRKTGAPGWGKGRGTPSLQIPSKAKGNLSGLQFPEFPNQTMHARKRQVEFNSHDSQPAMHVQGSLGGLQFPIFSSRHALIGWRSTPISPIPPCWVGFSAHDSQPARHAKGSWLPD